MLRVTDHFERSDTGRQRRANEDSFYARSPLFAIADGMGGAQAGEVASRTAVAVLENGLPDEGGSIEERLRALMAQANAQINALSRSDEERAGMGTTMTVAYVAEEELAVAHVGDSRLYRLRAGDFERLTDDHSLVEELVRQGKLTPQEADEHPQRSIITRALGPEASVEADTRTWPARDGDVYLLCSDGLTSMVPEGRVAEIVAAGASLADAGRALIEAANAAGGRDNITVVLFRLAEVGVAPGPGVADTSETSEHAAVPVVAPGPAATATATQASAPPVVAARSAREPRPSAPAPEGRRRRPRRRVAAAAIATLLTLLLVGLGAFYASQTVYFVGADEGFVVVYRGLPFDLPLGLDLYSTNYVSGVTVSELSARQRKTVGAHEVRSRDDAHDLVRRLETGEVAAR